MNTLSSKDSWYTFVLWRLCSIMSTFIIFWPHGVVLICVDAHFWRQLVWLRMRKCGTVRYTWAILLSWELLSWESRYCYTDWRQCFMSALTLTLDGWEASKRPTKVHFFGPGLTWIKSRKEGCLKRNCVYVCDAALAWLSVWSEVQMVLHMVQLMPLPPRHLLLR